MLLFKVPAGAAPSPDGGKEIDHDTLAIHFVQNLPVKNLSPKMWGAEWDDSTDDSTKVQNFVNYAGVNNCSGAWPAGAGRFSGIVISTDYQGLTILGVGKQRTGVGTGCTILKNNNTTPMFAVAGSGTHTGLTLGKFSFRQVSVSSGELFVSPNSLSEMKIDDIDYVLINTAKTLISCTGISYANNQLTNHYGTIAVGATVNAVYIETQVGGSYFGNIFAEWFVNSNNTATAPFLRMRDKSGGATNGSNSFSGMIFELCANGGAMHLSSIRQSEFTRIFCDDSSDNNAHLIHLDTDVTGGSQISSYNIFKNCISDEGDATFNDLRIESSGPGTHTTLIGCRFDYIKIDASPYVDIENQIISDLSSQPPIKILAGDITVPENGNINFQEGMSVPEMQQGVTGVIAAGGNEVVNFPHTFSNIPKVTVSQVGATDKGGAAQQSGASTTQVTVYNHGTSSSAVDWIAVAVH